MRDWIFLHSSVISAAAYKSGTLFIRFNTNHEYAYYHVPKQVFNKLIHATSIGNYFNIHVKPYYQFRQLC